MSEIQAIKMYRIGILSVMLWSFLVGAITVYGTLVDNSPFIPPNYSGTKSQEAANGGTSLIEKQIEFRGFYKLNGKYRFLLAIKGQPNGSWVQLGESVDPLKLIDFDNENQRVEVEFSSSRGWVSLNPLPDNDGGGALVSQSQKGGTGSRAVGNNTAYRESWSSAVSSRSARKTKGSLGERDRRTTRREGLRNSNSQFRRQEHTSIAAPLQTPEMKSASLKRNIPTIDLSETAKPSGPPEGNPPAVRPPRGRN